MARIVPGVEVRVVKEVLPPQLAPSGVLGLVGLTEIIPPDTTRAAKWSSFLEAFGPGTAFGIPAASQALANGVFELVVTPVEPSAAAKARLAIPDTSDGGKKRLGVGGSRPGAMGQWAQHEHGQQRALGFRGSPSHERSCC
jgi:hypothetical protein